MTAPLTPAAMRDHLEAEGVAASGFAAFLGIQVVHCWDGECELSLEVRRDLTQSFQTLHGGVYAALADIVSGFAAYSRVGPVVTADLATQMIAPAAAGRTVRAIASITSVKGRHVVVTSRLYVDDDLESETIAISVARLVVLTQSP
ncbi:PaaI family thioesterase [Sphingomonas sp. TX0522]|jgi:uncharacterized protein (TIGR00369 family)|uniref:PaaI family thioesterase n=1 Tax=Sphingomonas sp. TX0522 TaxID=2479205 RepID=UPI0018E00BEF|nr:PaaI family thioesterase [Sphingomonas sp. TX0522]MBI0531987.1 PaaI family thioesterase [Sphingomonas sp. TX0522]